MTDTKIEVSSSDFDKTEAAILNALYERADGTYSSHTLFPVIHPNVQLGTPSGGEAFASVRDATERLIARDLVRGERMSGLDGVYFNTLKLTSKGERAAINERNRVKVVLIPTPPGIKDAEPQTPAPTKPSWNK